jgi:hypothetical protein
MLQSGNQASVSYVGWEGTTFNILGGMAPQMDYQNGFVLREISGLQAPARFLDNQGARQDGTTYLDSVREPAQIDMVLEAWGATPDQFRQTVRAWIGAWRFDQMGILNWNTQRIGLWYMPVRQAKAFPDQLKQYPAMHRRQIFTWTARGDSSFWYGPDSVSAFVGNGSGFNNLINLGTEPAWPRHLCYGPGTFQIGDGISGTVITFGPLLAGQVALITTLPRLRSVVDLSASAPAQANFGPVRSLVAALVNFATSSNTPPLLQYFESLFGIIPPQGPMYSLLNGRFTQPIAGKGDGINPIVASIEVVISGGNGNSKIITAITPQRTYPE